MEENAENDILALFLPDPLPLLDRCPAADQVELSHAHFGVNIGSTQRQLVLKRSIPE